jgi:uncharacterized membrane protein YeiH
LLLFLDFLGVAVFAATGALAASRRELDIIGFGFFAVVTGLGGGTLRDVLLGVPVLWIGDARHIAVCLVVAVVVFFTHHVPDSRYRLLLWADAVGLSGYTVLGAGKALATGVHPFTAVLLGVMTATFGGILRDIVAGEPSVLLRREVYVTAALSGATVYVLAVLLGVADLPAALAGVATAFVIRGGAIRYGWSLPVYRGRPGRDQDESLARRDRRT